MMPLEWLVIVGSSVAVVVYLANMTSASFRSMKRKGKRPAQTCQKRKWRHVSPSSRANKCANREAIITIREPHLLPCQMSALADFASTLGSGVFVSSDAIYRLKTDDELEEDVVSAHMYELRQRGYSITCE